MLRNADFTRQGRHYGLSTKLEMSDVLRPPSTFIYVPFAFPSFSSSHHFHIIRDGGLPLTFTLDIMKHKRRHSYTWVHCKAREKIDSKALEIIVSYPQCRWGVFFFCLFSPGCLIWLFCFCVFVEDFKLSRKKSAIQKNPYHNIGSLGSTRLRYLWTLLFLLSLC